MLSSLFLLLAGCGLSGGSIPVGDQDIRGLVVRADDPSRGVEGATVVAVFPSLGARKYKASTDQKGEFSLIAVPLADCLMTVEPPPGTDLSSLSFIIYKPRFLSRARGERFQTFVLVPLLRRGQPAPSPPSQIGPPHLEAKVGDTLPLSIKPQIEEGRYPVWVVKGGIGIIDVHGRFTALREGEGEIAAVVGRTEISIHVVVREDPSTSSGPNHSR